ncbi:hypothetical protein NL676_007341 [Syzygium grande]|nr:hypothetical protein NL676_007341 [Syzygium grande]
MHPVPRGELKGGWCPPLPTPHPHSQSLLLLSQASLGGPGGWSARGVSSATDLNLGPANTWIDKVRTPPFPMCKSLACRCALLPLGVNTGVGELTFCS